MKLIVPLWLRKMKKPPRRTVFSPLSPLQGGWGGLLAVVRLVVLSAAD